MLVGCLLYSLGAFQRSKGSARVCGRVCLCARVCVLVQSRSVHRLVSRRSLLVYQAIAGGGGGSIENSLQLSRERESLLVVVQHLSGAVFLRRGHGVLLLVFVCLLFGGL